MASTVASKEELRKALQEECIRREGIREGIRREGILGRLLKTWEKDILEAQIFHETLKAVPKERRANIVGFSKMLTSAYNKFAALKRRPDFNDDILMPRKSAKTMAERQQKVNML